MAEDFIEELSNSLAGSELLTVLYECEKHGSMANAQRQPNGSSECSILRSSESMISDGKLAGLVLNICLASVLLKHIRHKTTVVRHLFQSVSIVMLYHFVMTFHAKAHGISNGKPARTCGVTKIQNASGSRGMNVSRETWKWTSNSWTGPTMVWLLRWCRADEWGAAPRRSHCL